MWVSLLQPKAVLHRWRKDEPQASVTADPYLPVCQTAANHTHRDTTVNHKTGIVILKKSFGGREIISILSKL